ncbi:unknown protein [Simkania negevensis Z]|uniref:Uncharacterized protein n=1 Tax=Simkania negevensis (strain ATCC VR-1471 / DSM 27360 / Z) TaxID=331113 RepID=F8L5C8_SIMNZ|nr:unknown protein [Simkania negevensis Z]
MPAGLTFSFFRFFLLEKP